MRKRLVKRMFREMAEGRPVHLPIRFAGFRTMARLACLAEQFGYRYADASQGHEVLYLRLLPDHSPQGRALAAAHHARYPAAASGGPLPPLAPEDVELLRMRISWDLRTAMSGRVRIVLSSVFLVPVTAAIMYRFRDDSTVVTVAALCGATLLGLVLLLVLQVEPRLQARHKARMRAAGLEPVTDAEGRLRYVPADPRLDQPGTPFPTP
ncbi:hypothetical protein AB0D49_30115 [Streptomyces sp. NPDC048290]|uniref:hypothetical protein n=1 Tax=Streptomyces sp. NPDC048290 TaxID=3155811 RepID=UPI00342D2B84